MNENQTSRDSQSEEEEKSSFWNRNWRIGAWLPWVLLHLAMSYLILKGGGPGRGAFELILYTVFCWSACALAILIFIFHRKNCLSYLITICLLLSGPKLSSYYLGSKKGEIIEKAHIAAEEVNRLCEEQGGDKIYRTVEGVEGVFQMVPMPGFHENLNDQLGRVYPWHRQMGERGRMSSFTSSGSEGYLFVEHLISIDQEGPPYLRTVLTDSGRTFGDRSPNHPHPERPILVSSTTQVNNLRSRYGWLSEDLTSTGMREQWISGGRIRIIDLHTKEVLAERTGFFAGKGRGALPWHSEDIELSGCPLKSTTATFVTTVLVPVEEYPTREKLDSLKE